MATADVYPGVVTFRSLDGVVLARGDDMNLLALDKGLDELVGPVQAFFPVTPDQLGDRSLDPLEVFKSESPDGSPGDLQVARPVPLPVAILDEIKLE